jgi:hypothetical protein
MNLTPGAPASSYRCGVCRSAWAEVFLKMSAEHDDGTQSVEYVPACAPCSQLEPEVMLKMLQGRRP